MNTMGRQTHMAVARDNAVQKLRDLTIAVAVVAAAGVGVIAWLSAVTIPGSTSTGGLTVGTTTVDGGQPISIDDGFTQAPPTRTRSGPGVAVSGGSHP
jgi:hypothetical protein